MAPSFDNTTSNHHHRSQWQALLGLTLVFVASRAYWVLIRGFELDAYLLRAFLHILHLDLLRDHLGRALLNLHVQPPVWNALIGLAVKAAASSGVAAGTLLYLLQMSMGLALVLCVYLLTERLTRHRTIALFAAGAWALSPALALYETWPLYGVLTATLVTATALFLTRHAQTGRRREAIAAGVVLALLMLTRASYHLISVGIIAGALMLVGRRRGAVLLAVVSSAIAVPWYAKNALRFGRFEATTISGCNFYRVSSAPGAEPRPFQSMDRYDSSLNLGRIHPDPELGAVFKEYPEHGERFTNLNNLNVIDVCHWFREAALREVVKEPGRVAGHILAASVLYWNPSTQHHSLKPNHAIAGPLLWFYETVLYAGVPVAGSDTRLWQALGPNLISRTPRLTVPFLLFWGGFLGVCVHAFRRARSAGFATAVRESREVLPALVLLLYGIAVGTGLELGENARFKFENEPLAWVLLLAISSRLIARRARSLPTTA